MKFNNSDAGFAQMVRSAAAAPGALKIRGDVGSMTESIHFEGDIIIHGSVRSGVRIFSGGSVFVRENVDGATIEAANDIWVNVAVNGMNKAVLTAGGDIGCKFLQDCTAKAGGNVYALSVLQCDISSSGDLVLTGRRAPLIGGHVAVGGRIIAKVIGAPDYIANASTNIVLTDRQRNGKSTPGYIECGRVCEKVSISFGDVSINVEKAITKSKIFLDDGEIMISPL